MNNVKVEGMDLTQRYAPRRSLIRTLRIIAGAGWGAMFLLLLVTATPASTALPILVVLGLIALVLIIVAAMVAAGDDTRYLTAVIAQRMMDGGSARDQFNNVENFNGNVKPLTPEADRSAQTPPDLPR